MGPWEKTFPFFLSHLLAIISRNVGTKGHLRKEIVLLKYQVFRFGTKKWWPVWTLKLIGKKHKAFDVGGLWYCSFHHPLGRLQNLERIEWYRAYIVSTKSEFRCLTSCIQHLMTKAGVKFGMLWSLYKFKIESCLTNTWPLNSKEKVKIFDFSDLNFKFWSGPFQMHIQILEYSAIWSFVDYSKFVWEVSFTV